MSNFVLSQVRNRTLQLIYDNIRIFTINITEKIINKLKGRLKLCILIADRGTDPRVFEL